MLFRSRPTQGIRLFHKASGEIATAVESRIVSCGWTALIVASVLCACADRPAKVEPVVLPVTVAGLDSVVSSSGGKITLVNVWASWCEPCRSEIPVLLKLQEEYRDKGLVLVFISTDEPDDLTREVKPLLVKLGLDGPSYILSEKDPDRFIRAMNVDWSGALPASFIYDSRRSLVRWFTGERSYDQFKTEITAFLD